jgi:hypothetical protein
VHLLELRQLRLPPTFQHGDNAHDPKKNGHHYDYGIGLHHSSKFSVRFCPRIFVLKRFTEKSYENA